MNLPTSIKVNGVEYRIAVTDVLDDAFAGGCHSEAKVIMISSRQNKREALATLFHEILHAIETEYKVTLGHKKINKLEYALAEVFEQLCSRRSSR